MPQHTQTSADDQSDAAGTLRLVAVSGGTSDPSSTRMLTDRIISRAHALAAQQKLSLSVTIIDLRSLAAEINTALVSQLLGPKLTSAVESLQQADGLIVSAPVYKAEPSGLVSSFFHVLDNDLLIAKPTLLAATAGTARHALVVDQQMRSLFAYFRTLTIPTSVFAANEDWNDPKLPQRIDRSATELLVLMSSRVEAKIKEASWGSYQHEFGSAGGTETTIDLNTDLMQLATGGNGRASSSFA